MQVTKTVRNFRLLHGHMYEVMNATVIVRTNKKVTDSAVIGGHWRLFVLVSSFYIFFSGYGC